MYWDFGIKFFVYEACERLWECLCLWECVRLFACFG